jgi:hypothetical protein
MRKSAEVLLARVGVTLALGFIAAHVLLAH